MNRSVYYDRITRWLSILVVDVRTRAQNNILDYNIHAENFYVELLRHVYGWNLINANKIFSNTAAIDLIDVNHKLIVQVTSQCTKSKINETLSKEKLNEYSDYNLKFIFISDNVSELKNKSYTAPSNIVFIPKNDIIDNGDVLNDILTMSVDEQQTINSFLTKELRSDVKTDMESDIVKIIDVLSKENLEKIEQSNLSEFQIEEKINFNSLNEIAYEINNQKIFYGIVDKIFKQYDLNGCNKSLAIKNFFRKRYAKLLISENDKIIIFWKIIEETKDYVRNFHSIFVSEEELDMYISILTVHAFIWCHIFENPQGYSHVTT